MRRLFFLCVFLFPIILSYSQENPKLIVGIVVDQLCNDYLYRFQSDFGTEGFRKLMSEGYYFPNTFFNYSRTSTGPGHASIFAGCTPSGHGIVENNWFDKQSGKTVYCTFDEDNGRSPKQLIGSTIADMLILSGQGRSKTIGVSLKDRGAILPVGHGATMALWYDDNSNGWLSSNYYMKDLPEWLKNFNKIHPPESFLATWKLDKSKEQTFDFEVPEHNSFEEDLVKNQAGNFPYDVVKLAKENGNSIIKSTPFGNTYTFSLAREIIVNEKLGMRGYQDFLSVSLSSTDYIGHKFGPYSEEVKDTYIKLDKDIAEFISFLNRTVGDDKYIIFLTSDHGVVPNIGYLESLGFNGITYNEDSLTTEVSKHLLRRFGKENLLLELSEGQVYLNQDMIELNKIDEQKIQREVCDFLMSREDIAAALTSHDMRYKSYTDFPRKEMQASYYHGRSGDVMFEYKVYNRSSKYPKGTGHGTPYGYDRNVPLLFYGMGIKAGISYENTDITQIAATLADLMKVQRPPMCTANSLAGKILK